MSENSNQNRGYYAPERVGGTIQQFSGVFHISADEGRYTIEEPENGQARIRGSFGVKKLMRDSETGDTVQRTMWPRFVAYGPRAERIIRALRGGNKSLMLVVNKSRLQMSSYLDREFPKHQNGQANMRHSFEFILDDINVLAPALQPEYQQGEQGEPVDESTATDNNTNDSGAEGTGEDCPY